MTDPSLGHALVTGAAKGIGRAIAAELSAVGYAVTLADRREQVMETAAEIAATGAVASGVVIDLGDRAAVAAMIAGLPPLAVLVNNAAIFSDKPFEALTEDDFREMYRINVVAGFVVAQEAARRMTAGARIVNIGSRSFVGGKHHAHYIASKTAIVGLTRAMAIDLTPRGIRVNCVAPGVIDTDLYRGLTPDRRAEMLAQQPTGRVGRPEDIARAVAFFADPRNTYITGQVLLVDGGKSLGQGRMVEAEAAE